jgi:transposase-like protein
MGARLVLSLLQPSRRSSSGVNEYRSWQGLRARGVATDAREMDRRRQNISAIMRAETKSYDLPYPKAAACLRDDRDRLFAYFQFLNATWIHRRTTHPSESIFAPIRLRADDERLRTTEFSTSVTHALAIRGGALLGRGPAGLGLSRPRFSSMAW